MNDDLLTRLRDLEGSTAHVAVDHAAVLRRGHRRRAVRAAGVSTLSAAVVAGTVVGASTLGHGGLTLTPASPAADAADRVDLVTGELHLPLDEWLPTSTDLAVMYTAVDLYTLRCMQAAGYGDVVAFAGAAPVRPALDAYGVWSRADVERTGYGSLASTDDDVLTLPMLAADAPDAAVAARKSCFAQATDAGYSWDASDATAVDGWTVPTQTAAGRAVKAQWAACLDSHGVTPPADGAGWVPEGAMDLPLEDQVRIAGIDLDCKESLGTLAQIAGLAAASQDEYVARSRDALAAYRDVTEPVLERDRAYLADAGITVGS